MGNNNKMTENDVQMVRVEKQVIMCWFVTFGSFRANELNFSPLHFLAVLMGNNNIMSKNYVQKIWMKNVVILRWFPFLAGFRV